MFYNNGIPALWIIPALPALGALIIFLFSRAMRPRAAGIVACASVALSFLWTLNVGTSLLMSGTQQYHEAHWTWISAGPYQASVEIGRAHV